MTVMRKKSMLSVKFVRYALSATIHWLRLSGKLSKMVRSHGPGEHSFKRSWIQISSRTI